MKVEVETSYTLTIRLTREEMYDIVKAKEAIEAKTGKELEDISPVLGELLNDIGDMYMHP